MRPEAGHSKPKERPSSPSAPRLPVHRLGRVFMGSFCRPWPRRLHRQAAAKSRRDASHRSADSFSDPHNFLPARTFAISRRHARMAAHQATPARSGILLRSRNSRGCGLELLLLRRHSAHQRGRRHHRAIYGPGVGVVLCSRSPPAKAHATESSRSRDGVSRDRHSSSALSVRARSRTFASMPTASSRRC